MSKNLPITDHAVVRYLERRYGLDPDGVREQIYRSGDLKALMAGFKSGRCDIGNGLTAVFKDGSVVTVMREGDKCDV